MSSAKPLSKSLWGSLVFTLGLLLVFIGERVVVSGTGRSLASLGGAALVLLAFIWRFIRAQKVSG